MTTCHGSDLRQFQTNLISRVKIPRLHTIDCPVEGDEKKFEDNLENALKVQITAAMSQPQADVSAFADIMASFSWAGVFERVQRVYFEALKNFEKG